MANLAEVAWLRSSYCDTNSCVHVALLDDHVAVKDENGSVLVFDRIEWAAFLKRARKGEFNLDHGFPRT
jgi:Domain of unknown function (DUF397)